MVALLVMVLSQTPPLAEQLLEEAKVLNQELEFSQCVQRLEMAATQNPSRQTLVAIELLAGICHHNLGQTDEAKRHFRIGLRVDPSASLPISCSPKTRSLFAEVQKRLEELAPEPTPDPVLESPLNAKLEPREKEPALNLIDATMKPARRSGWLLGSVPASVFAVGAWGTALGFGLEAKRLETLSAMQKFDSEHERIGAHAIHASQNSNLFSAIAGGLTLAAAVFWLLWINS